VCRGDLKAFQLLHPLSAKVKDFFFLYTSEAVKAGNVSNPFLSPTHLYLGPRRSAVRVLYLLASCLVSNLNVKYLARLNFSSICDV
jgi:hypothetical protein